MTNYNFGSRPNSYFRGQDVTITREEDGKSITVNLKDGMWAVNIKSEFIYNSAPEATRRAIDNLTEGQVEAIEQGCRDTFWADARQLAEKFEWTDIFSAGQSGGWLCVDDTSNWESESPAHPNDDEAGMVKLWIEFCFEVVALVSEAEGLFIAELRDANAELQVELSKYADWVGAEVRSLDGNVFKVAKLDLRYGRAALVGEDGLFTCASESLLVRKADGQVPARLTADPIMEQVFKIIEARGDVDREQLDAWLDADDDHDPIELYVAHVAPAVNAIEDAIKETHTSTNQQGD